MKENFREIIEKAATLPQGEEPYIRLYRLGKMFGHDKGEVTGKAFLADSLAEKTQEGEISWTDHGNGLHICTSEEHVLAIRKYRRGYDDYKHPVHNYTLTIADSEKVLIEHEDNDRDYSLDSRRRPIMRLFDIIVQGEPRKASIPHVCGLEGFGLSISDVCHACEAGKKRGSV